MNIKFIPGPMAEQRKKQAQAYIKKRAIEIYLDHLERQKNEANIDETGDTNQPKC